MVTCLLSPPSRQEKGLMIILCVDNTPASIWEMQSLGAAIGCHILGK